MTKRHYMYYHDPDYVNEMARPGYDPHLDLAKFAGDISQDELDIYTEHKGDANLSSNIAAIVAHVKKLRKPFKVVNYSSTYGVGAPKLARTMGVALGKAREMLDAFWRRNWAIRKVADEVKVRQIGSQMWLYNPVSKFWYSLRFDKDKFSTLNQGTGVYCFDSWLAEVLRKRPQLTGQFHDEGIWEVKKGHREEMEKLLRDSIRRVNDRLKLNVTLDIDVQFGHRYSDIH